MAAALQFLAAIGVALGVFAYIGYKTNNSDPWGLKKRK